VRGGVWSAPGRGRHHRRAHRLQRRLRAGAPHRRARPAPRRRPHRGGVRRVRRGRVPRRDGPGRGHRVGSPRTRRTGTSARPPASWTRWRPSTEEMLVGARRLTAEPVPCDFGAAGLDLLVVDTRSPHRNADGALRRAPPDLRRGGAGPRHRGPARRDRPRRRPRPPRRSRCRAARPARRAGEHPGSCGRRAAAGGPGAGRSDRCSPPPTPRSGTTTRCPPPNSTRPSMRRSRPGAPMIARRLRRIGARAGRAGRPGRRRGRRVGRVRMARVHRARFPHGAPVAGRRAGRMTGPPRPRAGPSGQSSAFANMPGL
jgi:hypothetical protein